MERSNGVPPPGASSGRRVDFADGSWPRDHFYIHGGDEPGSAGCIDLHVYNDDFHAWFRAHGKVLRLFVRYVSIARRATFAHSTPDNCPDNPGLPCDVYAGPRNTVCRYHLDDTLYGSQRDQLLQDEICPAMK
jgi:hypothetical protein